MWLVGLFSAFGIKLTSSIDDVVWLAPFLTSNSSTEIRCQNSVIYTCVCLTQTVVAWIIATCGRKAVKAMTGGNKDAWSTEKILTVVAGCLLAVYAVKLSCEYYEELMEGEEGGEEDPSAENGVYNTVPTDEEKAEEYESGRSRPCCCSRSGGEAVEEESAALQVPAMEIDSPDKPEEEVDQADKDRQQTLFVIAFIGSVDDLTLFVPLLVGKGFDIAQLMIGAFLAVSVIVSICLFIGQCKPIADCLAKIPLCAIVIVFATVLLLKGFVFDEEDHSHAAPTQQDLEKY